MTPFRFLLDRTAVLFLGVAAGTAIGYAFGTGNESKQAVVLAPEAAPIASASPSEAPPPPTGPAAPEAGGKEAVASADKGRPAGKASAEAATPAPIVDTQSHSSLDLSASSGRAIRVGVFGDSFGDGVWSALYRLLPGGDGFQVTKFSQQSTGFTRYKRLNLEQHDDGQLGDKAVDVAVIAFGANDAQGVCDGGHCGALMSAYWQQVIGQRVTSYVSMLRRHGAAIYWVGLPVMRDAGFDADAQAMDGFYRALMARLGVPFIDIRPLTTDPTGHYEAYYDDGSGGQKLLRANDGVHMSMNGYLRISKALAQHIRQSVAGSRKPAGDQAPASSQAPTPPAAPTPAPAADQEDDAG